MPRCVFESAQTTTPVNPENPHLVRSRADLLSEFGRVAFETRPFATRGGRQMREVAMLNERQPEKGENRTA